MKKIITFFIAGVAIVALSACNDSGSQGQSDDPASQEQSDDPTNPGQSDDPAGQEQSDDPTNPGQSDDPAGQEQSDDPEDVAAFFDSHLPAISGFLSDCFFVDERDKKYEYRKKMVCLTIDSAEQLKEIMYLSVEPPAINFDDYTLIIGFIEVGGSGFTTPIQTLDIGSKQVTLNLTVKAPESSYAVMCPLYFWGLYPKLPKLSVDVNIIH